MQSRRGRSTRPLKRPHPKLPSSSIASRGCPGTMRRGVAARRARAVPRARSRSRRRKGFSRRVRPRRGLPWPARRRSRLDRLPVPLGHRAVGEIGGALLGDHEVGARGSSRTRSRPLKAGRDHAQRNDRRDADGDADHGQSGAHPLPEEVLHDQRGKRHASEARAPGAVSSGVPRRRPTGNPQADQRRRRCDGRRGIAASERKEKP